MKTLKITIRTLMVCAIVFATASLCTSCNQTAPKENTENPQPPEKEEEKPTPKTVKRPDIIISSEEAKKHYDGYTPRARHVEKQMQANGQDENFRAARSLYLSKEDLEQYLAYIEQESKTVGVKPTGLRLFFSVYPEGYVNRRGNKKDAKKQTIFMAPTTFTKTEAGKAGNHAYTIGGEQDNEVILLQDILDGKKVAGLGQSQSTIQEASILNFFATAVGNEKSLIGNSLSTLPSDDE